LEKKIDEIIENFLENNPYSQSEVYQGIIGHKKKGKDWNLEVLRKQRSEERAIPKVSLHDVPLDEQQIEENKPKNKK
jgi:hypothetical protein